MKHPRPSRARGLTIVECMTAMTILSVVFLSVTYTVVAGHQHVHAGDRSLRAVRLASDLLEEIVARPWRDPAGVSGPGAGPSRTNWDIGDYHNLAEPAGALRDAMNNLYPSDEQQYARGVTVVAEAQVIADLGQVIQGLKVIVTVTGPQGELWQFARFIPEPL